MLEKVEHFTMDLFYFVEMEMEMVHFMNIVTHLVKRGMLACGWKCFTLHNFNAGREKKFVRH